MFICFINIFHTEDRCSQKICNSGDKHTKKTLSFQFLFSFFSCRFSQLIASDDVYLVIFLKLFKWIAETDIDLVPQDEFYKLSRSQVNIFILIYLWLQKIDI